MSKLSRRPTFAADTTEPVIHPGVEVLAAEHASESPVGATEGPETTDTASEWIEEAHGADYASVSGRFDSGAPPIVGIGDGTITGDGEFIPEPPTIYIPIPASQMPVHIAEQDDIAAQVAKMMAEEDEADDDLDEELEDVVGSGLVELPDGSVRIPVVIPQEMVEILRSWADGAGQPFDEYLDTILDMALNAVVNGQAVAG